MKKLLIVAALCLLSSPCFADELSKDGWYSFDVTSGKLSIYTPSFETSDAHIVKFWTKLDLIQPARYKTIRALLWIDCNTKQRKSNSTAEDSYNNFFGPDESKWEYISPGSWQYEIGSVYCYHTYKKWPKPYIDNRNQFPNLLKTNSISSNARKPKAKP